MRIAAQIYRIARSNVADVIGMERIDLGVLGAGQVVGVVTLNGLVEKGQGCEQHSRHYDRHGERAGYGVNGSGSGAHFKIGRGVALSSSMRLVRVEWGAVFFSSCAD